MTMSVISRAVFIYVKVTKKATRLYGHTRKNKGVFYGSFYIETYFAVLLPLRLFTCVKNEINLLQVLTTSSSVGC